jgi:hypothetical protein
MEIRELPPAIEPDYWNLVFHPSASRLARLLLGRFQHVSAFTYVPGYHGWILYDVQWRGVRIMVLPRVAALVNYTRGCAVIKFTRRYDRMPLYSRFGFYCVPAIKHLIGLSCVAAFPDALYRAVIANGGEVISEPERPAAAAAGSDVAAGTTAGTSYA